MEKTTTKTVQQLITRDMNIAEVVGKYPEVAPILMENGIHCVGCHVSTVETLEMGLAGHGLTDEAIDDVVSQLNEVASKGGEHKQEWKEEDLKLLTLTELAAEKLEGIMKSQNKTGWGVRIGVLPGGCAGYTYSMEFDNSPTSDDMVVEDHGIKLIVDKASSVHLKGVKIDYIESLQGSGFKFVNPAAKASCGCGKSFA